MDCGPPHTAVRGILQASAGVGFHSAASGDPPDPGIATKVCHANRPVLPLDTQEAWEEAENQAPNIHCIAPRGQTGHQEMQSEVRGEDVWDGATGW